MVNNSSNLYFRISLLGNPGLDCRGTHPKALRTLKARALLFYLVTESRMQGGKTFAKDTLAEMLWPGMPLPSALQNLRQAIYQLRKAFAEAPDDKGLAVPLLEAERKTIRLHPRSMVQTDLDGFLSPGARSGMLDIGKMESAVADYGGPFLQDFFVPGCPAFEEWIAARRRYFQSRYLSYLTHLTRQALEQDRPRTALSYAEMLTREDPCHEEGYQCRMRALQALGRRNEGLQLYREYATHLREQLDTVPGPEITSWYERLKLPPAPTAAASAGPPFSERAIAPYLRYLAGAGFVLLIGLIWYWLTSAPGRPESIEAKRIAVLPFENHTDQEYLANGLTDDVITQLTKAPGLSVISRLSSVQYRDSPKSPQTIGRELRAAYLLRGSIREMNGRLRVSVQLLETASAENKWAETFDRPANELFSFQSEIAQEVAGHLNAERVGAMPSRLQQPPTRNAEAYRAYLRGRYRFYQADAKGLYGAADNFRSALELDPNFKLAAAWLAWTYCSLAGGWGDRTAQEMHYQVQEALASLEDESDLQGFYYKIQGWFHLWLMDRPAAERYLRRAVAYDPDQEFGFSGLALVLTLERKFEEAQAVARQGLHQNPHFFFNHFCLGSAYYYAGEMAPALEAIEKGLNLNPDHLAGISLKSRILSRQGQAGPALRYLEKECKRLDTQHPFVYGPLGAACLETGDTTRARQIARQLTERHRQGEKYAAYYAALIYAGMGQQQQALDWLEAALAQRDNELNWVEVDFAFAPLRQQERYRRLLQNMEKGG